jgi:hypothetical protein
MQSRRNEFWKTCKKASGEFCGGKAHFISYDSEQREISECFPGVFDICINEGACMIARMEGEG